MMDAYHARKLLAVILQTSQKTGANVSITVEDMESEKEFKGVFDYVELLHFMTE